MPIQTVSALTITQTELDRANKALTDLAAAQVDVARLTTEKTALSAEVLRLNGIIAALPAPAPVPPVVVPPPAPAPAPARTSLYVDGPVIRSRNGAALQLRGIELMYGSGSSASPSGSVAACKSYGANTVAPLYQTMSVPMARAHLVACRAANVICGVNVDKEGIGRQMLLLPDMVALCNEFRERVYLECEVELGNETQTPDQWAVTAKAFVKALRDAGHLATIKVGSPFSGRDPRHAVAKGADVLAADPQHNLMFTWQAYWGINPASNWTYPETFGYPKPTAADPIAGYRAAVDAIKASGLCFLVGIDAVDDIGDTGYVALANLLHSKGISWQFWALTNDMHGSIITDDPQSTVPSAPHGVAVKALLTAQAAAALPVL
jgi:hypothetical protein